MCSISHSIGFCTCRHWQISLALGSQFLKLQPDNNALMKRAVVGREYLCVREHGTIPYLGVRSPQLIGGGKRTLLKQLLSPHYFTQDGMLLRPIIQSLLGVHKVLGFGF